MAMTLITRLLCAAFLASIALAGVRADDVVNGQGLLWKVEREGVPASYIFGTMHSSDPRVLAIPERVTRALTKADTLVLELRTTGAEGVDAAQALFQSMLLTDGRKLPDILGAKTYTAVAEALAGHGLPPPILEGIKPWGAYLLLTAPRPRENNGGQAGGRPAQVLDQVLEFHAQDQGIGVAVLETVHDQIAVFSGMAEEDMTQLVRELVAEAADDGLNAHVGAYFETVTERYLAGDLASILVLSRDQIPGSAAGLNARLMRRLIDGRNRRFTERLGETLPAGDTFVAVGALHLPGRTGLLNLLASSGFTVSRVDIVVPRPPATETED